MQTFVKNEGLVLKNLSIKKAESVEDMLNILFVGDTNRVVCQTPLNDVSTRSHCIFTIFIESKSPLSEVKTFSKINLVDLSGSERIGKTHAQGKLLHEACSINLSLHYLEQVIVCLQERAKGNKGVFVPYRNSLMTMMLKDSLGGNCKTRMISTVYLTAEGLEESLSTCHFSQRVALIKNKVSKNLVIDPNVLISKLKKENETLKNELIQAQGFKRKEFLTLEDENMCRELVSKFLEGNDQDLPKEFLDKLMVLFCFKLFKEQIQGCSLSPPVQIGVQEQQFQSEIQKLKSLLTQREQEIQCLLEKIGPQSSQEQE